MYVKIIMDINNKTYYGLVLPCIKKLHMRDAMPISGLELDARQQCLGFGIFTNKYPIYFNGCECRYACTKPFQLSDTLNAFNVRIAFGTQI